MSSSLIPDSMRAWTFNAAGAPDRVLSLNLKFPTPSLPTGSKVLIRISHAALSSAGVNLMADVPSVLRKNAIPELDFSGRVVAVGPTAPSKFAVGTPVFGTVSKSATALSGVGTLAEFVLLEADCLALKPHNMSFKEAAGLSSLGQVALEMVRQGQVTQGSLVLVNGASGGIDIVLV
jgi:NADPH:quinone reductase-like Zn-dependent oxidoreductase